MENCCECYYYCNKIFTNWLNFYGKFKFDVLFSLTLSSWFILNTFRFELKQSLSKVFSISAYALVILKHGFALKFTWFHYTNWIAVCIIKKFFLFSGYKKSTYNSTRLKHLFFHKKTGQVCTGLLETQHSTAQHRFVGNSCLCCCVHKYF